MSGLKGMEWEHKLRDPRKVNTTLEIDVYMEVLKIANERGWSTAQTVRKLVEQMIEIVRIQRTRWNI
jgi:hypothetical protein